MVKNLPALQETQVLSLGWEDPLEKGMATHSSVLAWRIPWTKELGRSGAKGTSLTWEGRVGTERPADIKWLGEHRRFYDCLVLNRRGLTREAERFLGIWRAWLRSETMNSQTRILEWVAFPFPGDLPDPGIKPRPPALQADSLPSESPGMPPQVP